MDEHSWWSHKGQLASCVLDDIIVGTFLMGEMILRSTVWVSCEVEAAALCKP